MKIQTERFGEVSVPDDKILNFVQPVLGFEDSKQYVLLEHTPDSPFHWLQSVQEAGLAFVITNPAFFSIPYEITLADDVLELLSIQTAEQTLIFNIVNVPADNPTQMTANLLAPIVINQDNGQAMQVVLKDTQYAVKTPLLPAKPSSTAQQDDEE
jgi:flagellar assembly factor FliW